MLRFSLLVEIKVRNLIQGNFFHRVRLSDSVSIFLSADSIAQLKPAVALAQLIAEILEIYFANAGSLDRVANVRRCHDYRGAIGSICQHQSEADKGNNPSRNIN